jgi:hypothetical protein
LGVDRDPDQVDLGLLGRQLDAGRLGVEAQHPRPRVRGAEPLLHQPGPDPPRRPELGDLLEQGGAGDEEERHARRDVVDSQAGVERRM